MKRLHYFVILILIISCTFRTVERHYIGNWKEKQIEYSESISFLESNNIYENVLSHKFFGTGGNEFRDKEFLWLRNPQNLWSFYNTVQLIGLEKFITKEQYLKKIDEEEYWGKEWIGLSLNEIVDSLILKYNSKYDSLDYYSKFWERRKIEGNDSVVFKILTETKMFYSGKQLLADRKSIDSELYQLMKLNVELNELDSLNKKEKIIEYFNYLKSVGLDHSAYNLIYETNARKYIGKINDSLLKTLDFDTITAENYWNTRNNASWIKTHLDNGP